MTNPPPLCIETIRVFNRKFENLPWHEARLNRTRAALWSFADNLTLSNLLEIPQPLDEGLYKCRVVYRNQIERVEFEAYSPRIVQSLRLIEIKNLDYQYKYADRSLLNAAFAQRGQAHDVLMLRDGMVTDTSYANIAFFDGQNWLTPAQPMLEGTRRAQLLANGRIKTQKISADDLHKFVCARLINAMLDFDTTPTIPVAAIAL